MELSDGFYFILMNDHREDDKKSLTIAELVNTNKPLWFIIGERDEVDPCIFKIIQQINPPSL